MYISTDLVHINQEICSLDCLDELFDENEIRLFPINNGEYVYLM